jgi:ATP-binding cassette subfamily F protein 3
VVVVSHDLTFLNAVVTDMIWFCDKRLTYYKGDYTNFEKVCAEEKAHKQKAFVVEEKKIQRIRELVNR